MVDALFGDPRLAQLYDSLDPDRSDLLPYLALAKDLGATEVLDIGCGTGTFACMLAEHDFGVVAIDPASASLDVARTKPHAGHVRWIDGHLSALPPLAVDLATMTANVAQVFLTDDEWHGALAAIAAAVRPAGALIFETRRPARKAWERWTREHTWRRVEIAPVGIIEAWTDLIAVSLPFVSFRHTYKFIADGEVLTSDSTLRFRELDELEADLAATGWHLAETREAPDRPGKEYVCIATRSAG